MASRALSREGHAAMSMRGESDRWILIQKNTFTNWVNEQLRVGGFNNFVNELNNDFDDGVRLCNLIQSLQGKPIGKVIKKPINHHQNLENVALALNAIAKDNVRLVNIGPEDIVNGNLKLILGLVWHLILRYQIGKTKFPAKKLMLAWLQAVIPECNITNFTSCWNDGVALHALINYCDPGIEECQNWRYLSRSDPLGNCEKAMALARQHFDIPLVVRPEDLSSPDLDELSGMTYLSYFMKVDSPGYKMTMSTVKRLLRQGTFNNFTTDWSDGRVLCNLVTSLGEPATPGSEPIENLQRGIDSAKRLGVEPILTAKEMNDPEVDHIGIMAYAAYFSKFKPVRSPAEKIVMSGTPRNAFVGQETRFNLRLEDDGISPSDVRAEVKGPDSNPNVVFEWHGRSGEGIFTPQETGAHRLNVYCENSLIVGCPVSFKVSADRSKVRYIGPELCTVGQYSEIKVDCSAAGQGDVECEARNPHGRIQKLTAIYRNGSYIVNFNPTEVGIYRISVRYDGEEIYGSPFSVMVNDPSRVRVYGLEGGSVGSSLRFNADTSEAGDGELHVEVSKDGEFVSSHIHHERVGLEAIDFTPYGPGTYKVFVRYNDVDVRGSPFTVEIVDSTQVSVRGDGISLVPVNRSTSFIVDTQGSSSGRVDVEIFSPSGSNVPFDIRNYDGEYHIEYVPKEVGDHRLEIKYNDKEVEGSPFKAKAYNTAAIYVTPLRNVPLGKTVDFNIDVTKAGEGQLEIMVNNGNLPNTVEMPEAGVYKITFKPESPGKQYVDINFNGEALPDSPFTCNAYDASGLKLRGFSEIVASNKSTLFTIESSGDDDMSPVVDIYSPSNSRVPASLVSQGGGNFKVEWTPNEIGRHRVEVEFAGRQIDGSPFYVDVFDLMSLKVHNFKSEGVGEQATFELDLANAVGMEEVEIVSPSGSNVSFGVDTQSTFDGVQKVIKYYPDIAGDYKIYVKFAGYDLPRCPFIQNIDEGGMPTAEGEGLYKGEEDRIANFYVDVGNRRGELDVLCEGPNSIAKTNIEPSGDRYMVTYIPVEVGIFSLSVRWNGKEIPGSPFRPKVVDARKVRLVGGWQQYFDNEERVRLIVGQEKTLLFDISQAGPGNLRAEVVGPSRHIPVAIDTPAHGQSVVIFTPEEEGNHYIHLFWSEHTLSGSPFLGYATSGDSNKVVLTGRGLKEAKVREEAEFVIDGSQAGPGVPEVNLSGVRAEIPNKVVPLGNGRFRCTYVPMIPGAYLLNITWNGRTLKGSPYKVNVIGAFFPNKVVVSGEGLKGGIVGSPMDILIDVKRAGPGELTASCVGPTQVAHCELEDNHDGTFILYIKPVEPGKHLLHVKYGGEHVQRSPFMIRVGSQPDASKVRVHGPGVEHGLLPTFKSNFTVETRGAGAGQLTVRVKGPRGGFQVEMYRDSQRDRTIICRYDPIEIGEYYISVKWSGKDVPGSPFVVLIYDTQHDLERALQTLAMRNEMERASSLPRSLPVSARSYEQWRNEL